MPRRKILSSCLVTLNQFEKKRTLMDDDDDDKGKENACGVYGVACIAQCQYFVCASRLKHVKEQYYNIK